MYLRYCNIFVSCRGNCLWSGRMCYHPLRRVEHQLHHNKWQYTQKSTSTVFGQRLWTPWICLQWTWTVEVTFRIAWSYIDRRPMAIWHLMYEKRSLLRLCAFWKNTGRWMNWLRRKSSCNFGKNLGCGRAINRSCLWRTQLRGNSAIQALISLTLWTDVIATKKADFIDKWSKE